MSDPTEDTQLTKLKAENDALRAALGITSARPDRGNTAAWFEAENDMLEHQKRIRAECEGLLETEEGRKKALFLLQFFHSVPMPMWAAGIDAKIVHWGERAADLYKHTPERAHGKPFVDLIVVEPERKQAWEDLVCIIFGQEGLEHYNLCKDVDKAGKQLYLVTCCFPVFDPRQNEVVQAEVSFDLSRLPALEADLAKMYRDHQAYEEDERARNRTLRDKLLTNVIDELRVSVEAERDQLEKRMTHNRSIIADRRMSKAEQDEHRAALAENGQKIVELKKWHEDLNARIQAATTIEALNELQRQIRSRGRNALIP